MFPNRFRNGREKGEQTDKQTFRFYISRDEQNWPMLEKGIKYFHSSSHYSK